MVPFPTKIARQKKITSSLEKIWETHTHREENSVKSNDYQEKTIFSMKDISICKDQAKRSTNTTAKKAVSD